MKLFAKSSRKTEANVTGATEEKNSEKVFQSDSVVEELLKLDPQTLNSKQRRMLKRYSERQNAGIQPSQQTSDGGATKSNSEQSDPTKESEKKHDQSDENKPQKTPLQPEQSKPSDNDKVSASQESSKKRVIEEEREASGEEARKSKKGKRQKSSEENLPVEERLRREEQRRLQKEAAEKRAQGLVHEQKHRHPLNSERRRANRRKPKWAKRQLLNQQTS